MENVFIITQLLQEQQYLQEQKFKQIYNLKTYGYKLWETEKKKTTKKNLKRKHMLLYVLITICQHGIEKGKFYPIFRDNRWQVKLV